MRRVVSSSEVPHLWAHQSQDEARNGTGSLYFRGKTIYSYRDTWPIATFVENARGQGALLFTSSKYSVTTSGHCSHVWSAIPNKNDRPIFKVPLNDLWREYRSFDPVTYANSYENRIDAQVEKVAKGKPGSQSNNWALAELENIVAEANEFCAFFEVPRIFTMPADFGDVRKRIQEARKEELRIERERKARAAVEKAESLERWLRGERVYMNFYDLAKTYLRIVGENVETSRGAVFPVAHAIKGLAFVRKVREAGVSYQRNGHTFHLGIYAIDSVDQEGNVKAGCHYVTWEEIERLAPQLDAIKAERAPDTSEGYDSIARRGREIQLDTPNGVE